MLSNATVGSTNFLLSFSVLSLFCLLPLLAAPARVVVVLHLNAGVNVVSPEHLLALFLEVGGALSPVDLNMNKPT